MTGRTALGAVAFAALSAVAGAGCSTDSTDLERAPTEPSVKGRVEVAYDACASEVLAAAADDYGATIPAGKPQPFRASGGCHGLYRDADGGEHLLVTCAEGGYRAAPRGTTDFYTLLDDCQGKTATTAPVEPVGAACAAQLDTGERLLDTGERLLDRGEAMDWATDEVTDAQLAFWADAFTWSDDVAAASGRQLAVECTTAQLDEARGQEARFVAMEARFNTLLPGSSWRIDTTVEIGDIPSQ